MKTVPKTILFIALFVSLNTLLVAQEVPSPRIANYVMTVSLNPGKKLVSGSEVLTWRNTSRDFVPDIYLHLYMNAFSSEKSTFMQESGSRFHGREFEKSKRGSIRLKSLKLANGTNLLDSLSFVSPDDGNPFDRTVARLRLPVSVPPGGEIKLLIEFETRLPRVFARAGYYKNFFMVAQWFPKVGVYQNGGWNCHQYHATSEFFADFGVYDVRIFVPKNYEVGATGDLLEKTTIDSLAMFRFLAEDVHDFAWAASPDFRIARDSFLKKLPDQPEERVQINLFYQSFHKRHVPRYLQAVKNAMTYFYEHVGLYPYSTLTMIDPPTAAAGAGGMEYPTLITLGTHWLIPKGIRLPETVAVHEFGHQYWYGMVANNEFEEAWLDEGINTYYETRIMDYYYGEKESSVDLFGIKISDSNLQWLEYLNGAALDPIKRNAWDFYSPASYSSNSYSKPAMMLRTFEDYVGIVKMDHIMRTYFTRWKFKHPTSRDFIKTVEDVTGGNWDWYFDQFLNKAGHLDYAIGSVHSSRITPEPNKAENDSVKHGKKAAGKKTVPNSDVYESTIKILREGNLHVPIQTKIEFANDSSIIKNWNGISPWKKWTIKSRYALTYVAIDPFHKIWLDENVVNNSWKRQGEKRAVTRLSLRVLFWIQNVLQLSGF
ncbi:MAG: M1 family metallopeptidase [Calditrichaeota bacterium]|nr:M1 family metallopeptidase [Calditrichota bacterium]